MNFFRVFAPFAAGYLLSYVFRTINAIISPELVRELPLSSGALGLLTSAYFMTFAAVQIPAGMLLDRYGPRRVESLFLLIAGTGAIAFAVASGEAGLLGARALIGLGVATCLMAPLKGIVMWYPAERQASLSGWMMVAGGTGALLATAPLEFVLRYLHWRTMFVLLGCLTYAVALWIWLRVPDATRRTGAGWQAQWSGVRAVFGSARFWWLGPIAGLGFGGFSALQGLWSVPWMMDVQGIDRAAAARHLLVVSMVTVCGYLALGAFATRAAERGILPRHLYGGGFALNTVALAMIVAGMPGSYLWWGLYGLGASVNVLGFTLLSQAFSRDIAARANTALNLLMFGGSFALQYGVGLLADIGRAALGLDTSGGLKLAFATLLAIEAGAYAWFVAGWRRHALPLGAA